MSRWAAAATVFATLAVLPDAGCSRTTCGGPPGSCPDASFNLRALDDSTVAWMFQGAAHQTGARLVPAPAPTGACSYTFDKGKIYPLGDAGAATLFGGWFSLRCNGGDAGTFDLSISSLGDFRDWSPGTFTIAPAALDFGIDSFGSGASCTSAGYPGILLTITVEAATGGAAPYPKIVPDDFVRTFRLDFDTSGIAPTKYGGSDSCAFPVVVGPVSLHLTQTAADYSYHPTAPCACD